MSDRQQIIRIAGTTICLLGLLTSALLPVTSNGGNYDEAFPFIVASGLGAAAFLSWIVARHATSSRQWLIPLWTVAAWGVLVGSLTTLSNYSGLSFHTQQLASAIERTERMRTETDKDGRRHSLDKIEDARQQEERDRKRPQENKVGIYFGLLFVAAGAAAAATCVMLKRRRA